MFTSHFKRLLTYVTNNIMKQNIANKRRVFQSQIRSKQIESIFTKLRNQLTQSTNQQTTNETLNQLLHSVPKSLPKIFRFMKQKQAQTPFILSYMMENLSFWVKSFDKQAVKIEEWSYAMQILIKMLEYCQNSLQRQAILTQSQQTVISLGVKLSEENKVLKNDINFLMLDYYLYGVYHIKIAFKSIKIIREIVLSLSILNWRIRGKQLLKIVYFCNNLLDFTINQDERSIAFEIFLEQTSILINFATILEQIYQSHQQKYFQNLIALILVLFTNLSFVFADKRLYKLITASDLNLHLINQINSNQQQDTQMELYLQLSCNLLLNYREFRSQFKSRVNLYSNNMRKEICYCLMEEIRRLCYQLQE